MDNHIPQILGIDIVVVSYRALNYIVHLNEYYNKCEWETLCINTQFYSKSLSLPYAMISIQKFPLRIEN